MTVIKCQWNELVNLDMLLFVITVGLNTLLLTINGHVQQPGICYANYLRYKQLDDIKLHDSKLNSLAFVIPSGGSGIIYIYIYIYIIVVIY